MHNFIVVKIFKRYYEFRGKKSNLVFGEITLLDKIE